MAKGNLPNLTIFFILIIISISAKQAVSVVPTECEAESSDSCNNKQKALPLKIIAIVSILITSMIGVSLPLVTRSIPALNPERSLFVIVKAFASGIILATGFMHVLPDSFDMLSSSCLEENPWHKFPFSGFLAMLSAIITLMIDSMATSVYTKKNGGGAGSGVVLPEEVDQETAVAPARNFHSHGHGHGHGQHGGDGSTVDKIDKHMDGSTLLRYRVIAMVSI